MFIPPYRLATLGYCNAIGGDADSKWGDEGGMGCPAKGKASAQREPPPPPFAGRATWLGRRTGTIL